jgi:hypothetical protein
MTAGDADARLGGGAGGRLLAPRNERRMTQTGAARPESAVHAIQPRLCCLGFGLAVEVEAIAAQEVDASGSG